MRANVAMAMMWVSFSLSASPDIEFTSQEQLQSKVMTIGPNAKEMSTIWKITEDEWRRYAVLMKGEAKYHWSHLDPVFVLGLNAKSPHERSRFAAIYARQEYTRTAQLLAFNNEYLKQMERLYGNEPLMDLSQITPSASANNAFPKLTIRDAQYGDKVILFVKDECVQCDRLYKKIATIPLIGISRNVFFVGDYADEDIIKWGRRMNITPEIVQGGIITLNHDRGEYDAYGKPTLPNAFIYRAGNVYQLDD